VVVELLPGQDFGVVVVVRLVWGHSTESSALHSAVTLLRGLEVSRLSHDLTVFILKVLLNVSSVLHVLISRVGGLPDMAGGLESSVVFSGLGDGLGIAHLQLASIDVLFTVLECIRRHAEEYTVDFTLLHAGGLEVSDFNLDTVLTLSVLSGHEHIGLSQSQGSGQGELTELSLSLRPTGIVE